MEKSGIERLQLSLVLLITLSGGLQDAYSYFCRGGVFANAQTGNIVLLCANLVSGNFGEIIKYLVPVAFFVLGAVVAKIIFFVFGQKKFLPWKQVVLFVETAALIGASFISQSMNLFANALVSFACAMQVLTFNEILGNEFASTMCIGNLVRMSSSLVSAIAKKDKGAWKSLLVYFIVIIVFGIGAGMGYLLQTIFGNYAILFSAMLTLSAALLLFLAKSQRKDENICKKDVKYENE